MLCPLCDIELPDNATECTRCDWVRPKETVASRKGDPRDWAALWLSLVPGLGHLYKGHVLSGALVFFVIGPGILALAAAVLPATLGLSIALPLVFLGLVMLHAFRTDDRRAHVIQRARELDHLQEAHGSE